ncbi:MAG TPA: DUF488 domain-containing protein, partial [Thermoanaerobaculia bacterium]|nr:DUF488 domain-containing protein [Thermoanaerobaculia bacterium]
TPDRPAWENASFRNHADHTATPEFRERMAELRELGRAHTRSVLCAEAAWWRCHRRTPARFPDYVRRSAPSGSARHLHAQPLRRGLQQRHIALAPPVPGQQLGRFGGRHPEGGADVGGRGDAPVIQLPADRHPQTKGRQPVVHPSPALRR